MDDTREYIKAGDADTDAATAAFMFPANFRDAPTL